MNGFADEAQARAALAPARDVAHETVVPPRRMLDLAAYRLAASGRSERCICFLNSFSEPIADGWLAALAEHARRPDVGIAGATGSYESAYTAAPRHLKPLRRLHFPPAPNPHVRSNAFALSEDVLRSLRWPIPRTKLGALRLESGRHSLTRQVMRKGLEAVVVGRDGRAYPPPRWGQSATFRSGDQSNLLVADNRTRQYADAGGADRARLEAMAWAVGLSDQLGVAARPRPPRT
jgi:hypothetical protein